MPIVENRVKEYRNGVHTNTYTEIDIPGTVASEVASIGKGIGNIAEHLLEKKAGVVLDKMIKVDEKYANMKQVLNFLSNFKDLNEQFDSNVSFLSEELERIAKYYNKKKDDTFKWGELTDSIILYGLMFVAIVFGVSGCGLCAAIVFILDIAFLYVMFPFVIWPKRVEKANATFENLKSKMVEAGFYPVSVEFAKVLNFYNSDAERVKLYNKEISEEDYNNKVKESLVNVIDMSYKAVENIKIPIIL